jgi:cysteine desulfurase
VPPAAIYLDNHATTRVDPRVVQAMLPWFSERYGNAASISHGFGHEAADAVRAARETIAEALQCPPDSLIFTSGATESNNLAIKGVLSSFGTDAHLVGNAAEHRAVLDPAKRLRRAGHPVTIVPVDACGRVDPQRVADALQPSTRLVSVMLANNEVGTLNPVAEIGALCRERGVVFHCDASQAVGRIPVDLAQLPVDLMSFTAHKLYGPKGVGALYVRRGSPRIPLTPQIDGGGHERGLRSGTLPVPLIVGFAEAMRLAAEELEPESRRLGELRSRLQHALCSQLDGLTIHGPPTDRLPGNLNVGLDGVDGEALMVGVAQRGLAVSSGSACTSADPEPSHVLKAMGVPEGLARASLRFGLGRFNTAHEVDQAAEIVVDAVRQLRDLQ